MSWQDIVISIGSALLTIGLIPTVVAKEKPAVTTSLTSGTIILVFAATGTTIGLWFTAAVQVITSGLWFVLAYQKAFRKE